MKLPSWLDQKTATGTWIGHGLVEWGLSIVGTLIGLFWAVPLFGGWLGATAGAGYFLFVREPMDKLLHLLIKDYDTPQYKQGVTPRVDKVGDTISPASFWVGYTYCYLLLILVRIFG